MAVPVAPNWQASILHAVGAPVTPANVTFLNAWARAEGGGAANNPFNTTQPAGGASSYNSVGVRNYTSPEQGIQATAQTLTNGRYGNILGALKQGTSPVAAAQALAASPWGTGSLVLKVLGANPNVTAPVAPPPTAPTGRPIRPVLPQPLPGNRLSPNILNILNQGNKLFGLPTLSSALLGGATGSPAATVARPPATAATTAVAGTTTAKPPKINGPTLRWIEHVATPFGLTVTSTTGGQHAKNSYHYRGRAVDFGGNPTRMAALANYALQHASEFTEMFYSGPGHPNFFISDGKVMPIDQLDPGLYKEHENHVHLAR